MTRRTVVALIGVTSVCLLSAGLVAGCAKKEPVQQASTQPATAASGSAMAAAQVPMQVSPVQVEAYVNKSDESQERTVKLLQDLESAYQGLLALKIHDVADGDEGTKAFKAAGLQTETIRVNGSEFMEFDRDGTKVTVAFQSPAGFGWTYRDLVDAIGSASRGTTTPLTAEEARGKTESPKLNVPVDVAELEESGKRIVALKIGDAEALRFPVGGGTGSALKRALEAKKTLEAALGGEFRPSDIAAKQTGHSWVVTARGRTVVVITGQDAKALGSDPAKLADAATTDIKKAVQTAVLPTESEMPPVTSPPMAAMMSPT